MCLAFVVSILSVLCLMCTHICDKVALFSIGFAPPGGRLASGSTSGMGIHVVKPL